MMDNFEIAFFWFFIVSKIGSMSFEVPCFNKNQDNIEIITQLQVILFIS